MLLEEGKTGSLVDGIIIAAESLDFHNFSGTVLFLDENFAARIRHNYLPPIDTRLFDYRKISLRVLISDG